MKAVLFSGGAMVSLVIAGQSARAQTVAAPPRGSEAAISAQADAQGGLTTSADDGAGQSAEITVTGSRIVRDGYSAPTPVTVLGSADIAAQSPANISDFVNQLPAITPGSTSANSSGSLSSGIAGINSVNLRGLGAGRTLVLLDGQRSVASSVSGIVDVNTFPQELVERVEVVTGGASAQYGSDAVGGVINFILDKKFTGFKLSADEGLSTYGDGHNYNFAATAGLSFLDDRIHVLLNGEYYHQSGVNTIDRSWNDSGYFQINNPAYTATNGQPQRLVGSGFAPATYTSGGLVASGPLRGTYFLGNGTTGQLNYGTTNTVSSPWMIGGDGATTLAGHVGTNSLLPTEKRMAVFDRTSFDLTDDIQIYGQFSWNRYEGQSFYQQTPSTGVTIQRDNAYLTSLYPQVAAQMAANNLTSLSIGTSNAGFPVPGSDNTREVFRYVAGASGKFSLFDRDWKWDAYYQHGVTKAHEELTNTWNNARMALAQDAVFSNGQIVCRSTLTNPGNGCVPINRLGTSGPSQAALNYIYGAQQPYRDETIKQDVASASINGELFNLPGGPVAIAIGGEWRKEQINGYVDPQFNSGWLYGNYLVNKGQYNVREGFVEIDAPLFKGFNLNAAGRYTDYSTSGTVQTWKAGATYSPIPDIKFRGTYSHDIRAPNLQELFAAGTARTNTVILPANSTIGAGSYQFVESTIGNRNLKPEKANTWTAGFVTTPRFLPGFTASFDYYDIKITDAIGSITAQNTVDFCYTGSTAYCSNIAYSSGTLSTITIQPFNFASQREKGFDIAASYRTELAAISPNLPGAFSIHADVTHYISNVIDNGIFPVDYAGVNGGSLAGTYSEPSWVYRVSAFYEINAFTFNLVGRGFSSGVYGNDYIECTSNCPTSTTQYRTINDNSIKGIKYFDASVSVKVKAAGHDASITLVVNNIFNKAPVLIGNGPDGNNVPAAAQTNRSLYDVVGRVVRVSTKLKF
ncbi:TonB-dependent receptor [Sphingomonas sp. BIUV-7]|uniref:TonB-dependent receptor n=1 Tax=Sphingomonas natans TaxID=3063330 RepID=A0ABT8Y9L3_9SPHN|nr:TonB-dependent receptor [Sphingomonas sp. BIUV-7]MDO6414345.1 TonB-dependent receptor [Sphingomonas sp. BIUV-7]